MNEPYYVVKDERGRYYASVIRFEKRRVSARRFYDLTLAQSVARRIAGGRVARVVWKRKPRP